MKILAVLLGVVIALAMSSRALAEDSGTPLCSAPPTIDGPVFVWFDSTYAVYTSNLTTRPDGTYEFTRRNVDTSEITSICAEGYDLRAVPDSTVQGSYFPTAVEFYNAALDHYFVTTSASEIADLDAGVHGGWARTGQQFATYVRDPTPVTSELPLAPVCRYYGQPAFGLDTHFYSSFQEECEAISVLWPEHFVLETAHAFRAHLPDAGGVCATGTRPLFRLYNARADVNHRYTTSVALRDEMIGRGWIPEGYGAQGVAMCMRPD